jgi:hypothetical protein
MTRMNPNSPLFLIASPPVPDFTIRPVRTPRTPYTRRACTPHRVPRASQRIRYVCAQALSHFLRTFPPHPAANRMRLFFLLIAS